MSLKGGKIHDVYKETHFFPWWPVSFLTRFLNYNETCSPPTHPGLTDLNSCIPNTLGPVLSHQASTKKQPWREQESTVLTYFYFVHSKLHGPDQKQRGCLETWQLENIHQAGLPLSYLSKGRTMEQYREEHSATKRKKGICRALGSLQGMREMFAELKTQRKKRLRTEFTLITCLREGRALKDKCIAVFVYEQK